MKENKLNTIKIWWMALRPKTLPASIIPVIMGIALAKKNHTINFFLVFITLFCAILIQIGTNLVNDYSDFKKGADDDKRIGPLRVTQAGLISESNMKRGIYFVLFLILLSSIFLIIRGGIPILIIGISALLAGYYYTGGSSPYGYLGFGDIFVLIFFGPVSLAGAYYIQTLTVNPLIIFTGLGPGLISVAILTVNNIRDIDNDRRTGKKTLVVRLGRKFGIIEYNISIIIASFIPLIASLLSPTFYANSKISIIILLLLIHPYKILKTYRDGEKLNEILSFTGKILVIYGIIFILGLFI
jgi:1,4-dihydroxy-2-naphthoate octaprenyltransferase